MDVIQTIFGVISQAITSFVNALTSAVNGVTALFYVEGSGDVAGHMTFLGVLLLIAGALGIVYWAFRMIRSLVHRA